MCMLHVHNLHHVQHIIKWVCDKFLNLLLFRFGIVNIQDVVEFCRNSLFFCCCLYCILLTIYSVLYVLLLYQCFDKSFIISSEMIRNIIILCNVNSKL